jgi:NADH-quinone oxidoreductase subunit L
MMLVVHADDLIVLLVGWEVMGVCSYFLIGHYWELPEARAAAVKAFLTTRVGDVAFLFGIFTLGLGAGTFNIGDLLDRVVAASSPRRSSRPPRCCCSPACAASRHSSRCTRGFPTRWPARRRSAR